MNLLRAVADFFLPQKAPGHPPMTMAEYDRTYGFDDVVVRGKVRSVGRTLRDEHGRFIRDCNAPRDSHGRFV